VKIYDLLISVFMEKFGRCAVKNITSVDKSALNRCFTFETDKGNFFVKLNDQRALSMYEAEAKGLQILRETKTFRLPEPVYWGKSDGFSFFFMEHIPLSGHTRLSQKKLGVLLAKLHLQKKSQTFGFQFNNTIGTTPQVNDWRADWLDFFLTHRLEYQLKLLQKTANDDEILSKGMQFIENFSSFFKGITVYPSLLHGDLWSGNTATDQSGEPVVFDPAPYYGHHEADFGILLMFGGFSSDFYTGYRQLIPMDPGFHERQAGYQLYHYLNHYNLFGSSYRSECLSILSRFT